jgi:hypothetical protein
VLPEKTQSARYENISTPTSATGRTTTVSNCVLGRIFSLMWNILSGSYSPWWLLAACSIAMSRLYQIFALLPLQAEEPT